MRETIRRALREDLGPAWRDLSTEALGPARERPAIGEVLVKADGVLCGIGVIGPVIELVEAASVSTFRQAFPTTIEPLAVDGDRVGAGTVVARLRGPVCTLLTAERTLLNLMQRLSGIATLTRRFVDAVAGTRARILDTRKTTPGLRSLEKTAVRTGGGVNHRFGLYDMVMLKDNHLTAMGGDIALAVAEARRRSGPAVRIEVETATLEQVRAAVAAGADLIMLDNMPPALMRQCVAEVAGRVPLEASGGITLETVRAVAETGVDYISVGALTHSAPALDISMKIRLA
ncbi:MAG: Quinolinate phosphoribosyltransferase [decarboxylating] [Candidatus Ozemobacter sibiricus]|jgi:nicotinate-nucleotide pyrophosphorylase (carboxylating)|uniref:nicotinate-nucleotide diphosphorylase (carboxylating) n=1 Tax=Candidatus Ozemobacter sibiricus TaxID=2268124 RepID=A0A367ZQL7_9BACT|nr:MAG: Quinolinate phosphoribosyltransferase [decarboxylating] [Candidatus Ozemobacter sibiricus]